MNSRPLQNEQQNLPECTQSKNVIKNEKNDINISFPENSFPGHTSKSINPDFLIFSKEFHTFQQKQVPKLVKTDDKTNQRGAEEIERLIRIDKFEFEFIKKVLTWGAQDAFWSSQLRSLAKIRNRGKNGDTKFNNLVASYCQKEKNYKDQRFMGNLKACEEFLNE